MKAEAKESASRMTTRALIFIFTTCQIILGVLSEPLLKVPKVYNALITTDQNLAPSRAYPVIQPVVHRTAIGYSPPFYYQPGVPPAYAGNYDPGRESAEASNSEAENMQVEKQDDEERCKSSKPSTGQVPLSFYPNFKSTYYDPYFYGFNVYPAFPTPGNYYFNYQPQSFAPSHPQSAYQVPGYQGPQGNPFQGNKQGSKGQPKEDSEETKNEEQTDKIPDVPPPPLPARRSINRSS